MSNAPTDPQASALARLWRPAATALAALALAAALAACSGGDDEAPEATPTATPVAATPTATATATPTPTPTPTPEPPTATATPTPAGDAAPPGGGDVLPPELMEQVMQLLLEAMSDPDSKLFSGSIDALPPELLALLDVIGADLLLGVVTVDLGVGTGVVLVMPDSPAARGGLAEGDLISAIDGAPVGGAAALRAAVEALAEGAPYTLTIDRGGAARTLEVEREAASAGNAWRAELLRSIALLLALQEAPGGPDLPPSLLGEMVEETPDGLLVFAVFPGSPADVGGVRPGDLLVSVAGRALTTLADLDALMLSFNPGSGKVEVVLLRDGEELTLEIDLAVGGMLGGGAATQ